MTDALTAHDNFISISGTSGRSHRGTMFRRFALVFVVR